jgi:uncharacterized protein (TIGR03435 family)
MQFDVASVKQNTASTNSVYSNFSWTTGDNVAATGGLFAGTGWPLYQYILFAYKASNLQSFQILPQLPKWATTNRYDIQARVDGNPTKDQFRLMMQSLLADRFKFALHYEMRPTAVLALVVDKPGKLGPQLRSHVDDPSCNAPSAPATFPFPTLDDGFPIACGMVVPLRPKTPGRAAGAGARNITMSTLAAHFSPGVADLDHPLVDRTGLTGLYDFRVEWTPSMPPNVSVPPEMQDAPTLSEALKDQLGLKLESATVPLETVVVDHIEEPSAN